MNLQEIIEELCSYEFEKEWFEFKENFDNDDELGEYISALSNSAAYCGKKYAYFIWGINDKTHNIVGTNYNFDKNAKNGSAVLKAIKLGHTLHGYQFAREKLPYMKQYTPSKGSRNNKKAIVRLDENGIVETFDSTLAAVKAGYNNVSKALKFGIKCKGFYFKYLED